MSNLSRLSTLQSFAEQEPEDPFNWYALALEYMNIDQNQAKSTFQKLLKEFPQYLPTYYTAANFFAGIEDIEKAQDTFIKGLALAKSLNQTKTYNELNNSYQNFLFENDLDEEL